MDSVSIEMDTPWYAVSAEDVFVFGKNRRTIDVETMEGRNLSIWIDDDHQLVEMTVAQRTDGVWLWAAKADEKTGEAHSRDAARRLAEAVAWDVAVQILRDEIPTEGMSRWLYALVREAAVDYRDGTSR